jgi:hypothetical protein
MTNNEHNTVLAIIDLQKRLDKLEKESIQNNRIDEFKTALRNNSKYIKEESNPVVKYKHGQYFQHIHSKAIHLLAFVSCKTEFQLIEISNGCRVFSEQFKYEQCNSEFISADRFKPITYTDAMKISWEELCNKPFNESI